MSTVLIFTTLASIRRTFLYHRQFGPLQSIHRRDEICIFLCHIHRDYFFFCMIRGGSIGCIRCMYGGLYLKGLLWKVLEESHGLRVQKVAVGVMRGSGRASLDAGQTERQHTVVEEVR